FFFSSRRRHTISTRDWSSDVCSSDLFAICHAGIQNNRSAVIQQRQRFLDCEVRSLDVDVKLLVVQRLGRIRKRREFCHARVHKQDINLAELLLNFRVQLVDVCQLGHVRLHCQYAVADRFYCLVQRLLASARDSHFCSFFLQTLRGG